MRSLAHDTRLRILALALAGVAAATLLFGAGRAEAAPVTILDATREALGFEGAAAREKAFDDMAELGVDYVRILVWWRDMVPKPTAKNPPPGFDQRDSRTYGPDGKRLRGVDTAVRMAYDHGMRPYLVPSTGPTGGKAPRWASRNKRRQIDPKPVFFKRFMYALGQRYRGDFDPDGFGGQPVLPRVPLLGIINEPNGDRYLAPQRKNGKPYSPKLYRRLYIAARAGLRGAGWKGKVLIGETSPRAILGNVEPLDFLRGVLCLDARFRPRGKCAKLKADGWAHHPYALKSPPWQARRDRDHISIGSLGRLNRPLRRAWRAGRITRGVPIWITEFGYQSFPDKGFGLSLKRQAEYISIAERIAHAWGGRVRSYAQYLLHDDRALAGFQSGLRFRGQGSRKPSFRSFRLPLAIRLKSRGRAVMWGHVRPANGKTWVRLRVKDRGRKVKFMRSVKTNKAGYFVLRTRYRKGRRWGASWSGKKGPLVRGYRY